MTNDSVALVFGAAGGIGSEIARRLASDGYRLILADSNEPGLAEMESELHRSGASATSTRCNILDDDEVSKTVHLAASGGTFTVLVNAAGLGTPQSDDGRQILRANFEGTARTCAFASPLLNSGGCVINIGSVATLRARLDADDLLDDPLAPGWIDRWDDRASDTWEAYGYSKRGVLRLTEHLAVELGPRSIRANVVSPVVVSTNLGMQVIDEEGDRVAQIVEGIPLRRLCNPSDIASAVAFLVSEEASFVTGIELRVDGGSGAAGLHARPAD